jgi:hypothetical protein
MSKPTGINKTDKDVLMPQANTLVQPIGDSLVKGFLDLDRTSLVKQEDFE